MSDDFIDDVDFMDDEINNQEEDNNEYAFSTLDILNQHSIILNNLQNRITSLEIMLKSQNTKFANYKKLITKLSNNSNEVFKKINSKLQEYEK